MKRRIRHTSLLLTLCLALTSPFGMAQEAAASANAANQKTRTALTDALGQKNWKRALRHIDALLKDAPQDVSLLRQKAACLGKLNRDLDAANVMREASKLAPNDSGVWNDLCWHLMLASGPQKAQLACERSVKLKKNAINTANLGHTYLLTAESKSAYRWYRESVQLLQHEKELTGPQGPVTAFNRFIKNGWLTNESRQARTWMQNHFWARQNAEAFVKRAHVQAQDIDTHPERYLDAVGKRNTAAYKRDNAEIITLLEKALVIVKHQRGVHDPQSIDILLSLADRHAHLEQYKTADALLQRAFELVQKSKAPSYAKLADILERRITLHTQAREYRKTLPFIDALIALTAKHYGNSHPQTRAMMNRFIAYHQAAGDVENELSLRLRLLAITEKTTPPSKEVLKRIAMLYAYTDDFDRAARFNARANALGVTLPQETPTLPSADTKITSESGKALDRAWRTQNWQEALQYVDAVIAAQPNDEKRYRWKAYFLAQLGKKEEAIAAYRQSIAIQPNNPHAWNGLCWQLILHEKLSEARRACLRSVALQKDFANTANLGHTYLLAGDHQNAYEHYRDSAALLMTKKDLLQGPVKDLTLFIEKKWKPAESEKAREWFQQAYVQKENRAALMPRIFALLKTKPTTRNILIRYFPATKADKQVISAYQSGEYTRATKLAAAIKTDKKEKAFIAAIRLNNAAVSHIASGNVTQALPLLERAAAIATKSKGMSPVYTVAILNNLAIAQHQAGKAAKGLASIRRAFALSTKQVGPTHAYTRTSAANLGALYEKNGALGKAASLYQRLLEETDDHGHPIEDHVDLASRISWMTQAAHQEGGREWHDRSLAAITLPAATPSLAMATAFNNLAAYQSLINDQAAMLAYLQQAYNIHEKLLGATHPDTLASLRVLALINWSMDRIPDALSLFDRYVTLVERRCHQTTCTAMQDFDGYKDYAQLLAEQAQLEKAYQLFELSKLRTRMKTVLSRAAQLSLPQDKARELGTMQDRFIAMEKQLEKTEQAEKRAALLAQQDQVARDMTALYLKLAPSYPRYAQLTTPPFVAAQQAAKQLAADSVFLSYLVNDGHLLALLIEPDGQITYRDMGTPVALDKTLQAYHAALSQKQGVKAYASSSALQAQLSLYLLAPLKDKLQNKRHWIISNDEQLSLLPFETLRMDNAPVLQTHDISYTATLSSYAALRQRAAAYAATPRNKALFVMSAIDNERSRGENDETAIEAIGKLFTDQEASLYLGEQSSPAQLDRLNALDKLKHYRYFFFASEDQRFTDSGSPNAVAPHADWLRYQLHSDLVVLPPTSQSDTLPFQLSLAGNVNTLIPLWPTDESIQAEFFRRFFVRLKAGEDQVKALNAVKREFLNTPLLSEPTFWAPFVLHGL